MQDYTLPHNNDVRECKTLHNHDVFRFQALGKSGCEIWEALLDGAKTIKEISEKTGQHRTTVKRKLERMQNIIDYSTGELISMVLVDVGVYSAKNNIDLNYIAKLLGALGKRERQKAQYELERKQHFKNYREK